MGFRGGSTVFVHSVYFWLKSDLSPPGHAGFRIGLESLASIPDIRNIHIGVPAPTDRPVIDRSYSYALTIIFDNLAAHDAYQLHPIHLEFVRDYSTYWSRVRIYDAA